MVYPPVIFVLLPDVFVCELVSSANKLNEKKITRKRSPLSLRKGAVTDTNGERLKIRKSWS